MDNDPLTRHESVDYEGGAVTQFLSLVWVKFSAEPDVVPSPPLTVTIVLAH